MKKQLSKFTTKIEEYSDNKPLKTENPSIDISTITIQEFH